jgi:hypothetical protein
MRTIVIAGMFALSACGSRGGVAPVGVSTARAVPSASAAAASDPAATSPSAQASATPSAPAPTWRIPTTRPEGVVVDSAAVYFVGDDCVKRAEKESPAPKDLHCPGEGDLHELRASDTHVYVARTRKDGRGEILQIPKAGGAAKRVAETPSRVLSMATDGQHVFWGVREGLFRAPAGGGSPVILQHLELGLRGVALSGDDVFFAKAHHLDEVVRKIGKGGGPANLVVDDRWVLFAADHDAVYGTEPTRRRIFRQDLAGGGPRPLARSEVPVAGIAIDAKSLYFAGSAGFGCPKDAQGTLHRVSKTGGEPVLIGARLACPRALAVDDAHVYVASREIVECPPPRSEPGKSAFEDERACKITGSILRIAK